MDKCGTFVSGLTKTTTSNGQAALYNVQVLNGYNYVLPMIWDPQSQSCSLGSIFVSEWTAVGCYTDNPDPRRILSHQVLVSSLSSMTIELCQTACMNAGYIYAGVESGSECRCDNVFAPSQEASTVCTTPCTGNSAELCGGSYAINVYKLPYISTPQSTLLGCYVDSASPNRVLGNKLTLASTAMTIETCQAACFNAGYKYAGLEGIPSIQECW